MVYDFCFYARANDQVIAQSGIRLLKEILDAHSFLEHAVQVILIKQVPCAKSRDKRMDAGFGGKIRG